MIDFSFHVQNLGIVRDFSASHFVNRAVTYLFVHHTTLSKKLMLGIVIVCHAPAAVIVM